MSFKEQEGAEYDINRNTSGIQKSDGNGRKQQSVDKYFSLRYNPNWKNTREAAKFAEAEKTRQIAGGNSVDFPQDSFYLHSSDSPEENNQQKAKSQDSFSAVGTELLNFHKRNAVVSNEPFRLHTKGKASADGCHFKGSPSTYSKAFSLRIQQDQPQRAKKDFVEKNKRTLGLCSEKINSYLQLHNKKQGVLQKQVADPKTVDEEPVQSVLPFQTGKMKPEDRWHLKSQQLKDHQNKLSQKNKRKPNQSLKRRTFQRNDNQQLTGIPAEPKSWHHRHNQIPELQPGPMLPVEQDNSSTLQKWLYPSPHLGPDTNTAANSDTYLNNFPNSRHFEKKKYEHVSPNGHLHDQQHLYNRATVLFARDNSTNGQAHPNQRNISSAFNANSQELMKEQVPLQDCKRHIYADKRLSQSSFHSLPTAPCATFQSTQTVEPHHQEITCLTEAHLADRHLFSQLPAVIPEGGSGSEVDPERGEGNQEKMSQSNSERSLMQMEKQKQPKVSKKPRSSKTYINVNVKLGGLGPDYEAVKEKKEKLRQQKEYAKKVKEHNMKSVASVQRLPTKPQVQSSVSRQKALEYAKKIPRPKIYTARQSEEEAKEKKVLPQTLNGDHLPQIASLEALQSRHEKEKQVVAAFKTLHILQV
ncbi:PREDICTED: uncharacterized protein C11orf63 homolog, partial [Tauraco erythrolophus]|uniref:uncharacterized protein C11orf63 homolog n=1 Tax=Tauraco erythrolophus TaxID=121530 RepID=UPI000523181C